jgi:hypothetical protein
MHGFVVFLTSCLFDYGSCLPMAGLSKLPSLVLISVAMRVCGEFGNVSQALSVAADDTGCCPLKYCCCVRSHCPQIDAIAETAAGYWALLPDIELSMKHWTHFDACICAHRYQGELF